MKNISIPYSLGAEEYVLGSIMIDSNLADEFCGRLTEDHFYNETNRKVYHAILKIYKKKTTLDVATIIEELKTDGIYEVIGGSDKLFALIDSVPTTINAEAYVEILEQKGLERALYYEAQRISSDIIKGEKDFQDILAKTEKNIYEIVNKRRTSPLKSIEVATEETMKIIEDNKNRKTGDLIGLDTGFDELNQYIYGLQSGDLIILAARPSVGKSAFALNVASKACENSEAHVAFFSLEMGIDQLVMRLLSSYSTVSLSKIRKGDLDENDAAKLLVAKKKLDTFNLYLDENTSNSIEDLKVKCRKYKREGKLDLVVIDYLQLLSGPKNNRYEEVSYLSRALKLLARELNVPIIALSQLSREVEKRKKDEEGAKPMLSDLRESGSIEQDADIVMFLHRENSKADDEVNYRSRKVELIIAKNRQGMTGSFNLQFRGECSQFTSQSKAK